MPGQNLILLRLSGKVMTMRMVLVMMVMILNQNGWNGDSWRMFCLLQQLYKSAFTLNFIRVPWLECKQCNKCGFFLQFGFLTTFSQNIVFSLNWTWKVGNRKQALSLRLRQTIRKTDYQADNALHRLSTFQGIILGQKNLIYWEKHPDMLKFESLCSERQQSDLRVLCFEAGDQTISQGGQVRLSRLPTEDVMVVRQRTNPTKWKGVF